MTLSMNNRHEKHCSRNWDGMQHYATMTEKTTTLLYMKGIITKRTFEASSDHFGPVPWETPREQCVYEIPFFSCNNLVGQKNCHVSKHKGTYSNSYSRCHHYGPHTVCHCHKTEYQFRWNKTNKSNRHKFQKTIDDEKRPRHPTINLFVKINKMVVCAYTKFRKLS